MSISSGTILTDSQLDDLRAECAKLDRIDPCSPAYAKMIGCLDQMPQGMLWQVANAKIKFLSALARNRIKI